MIKDNYTKEEIILMIKLSEETGISFKNIFNAEINSDEWIELTSVAAKLAKQIEIK